MFLTYAGQKICLTHNSSPNGSSFISAANHLYCSSLLLRSLLSTCGCLVNPCCVVRLVQSFVRLVYLIWNGASKGHKSFAFLQNNLYIVVNTWNTPNWEIIQNIFTFGFKVWTKTSRIKPRASQSHFFLAELFVCRLINHIL